MLLDTQRHIEPAKEMVWRNIMLHLTTRIPEKFRGYTMMGIPKAYEFLDYIIVNLHPSVVQEAINDIRVKMKTMASGDFRNLARFAKDLCTIEILVNMSISVSAVVVEDGIDIDQRQVKATRHSDAEQRSQDAHQRHRHFVRRHVYSYRASTFIHTDVSGSGICRQGGQIYVSDASIHH